MSVILPTYNRASLLDRAIQSVRGQTMGGLELIVVDDGSTDDTQAVLQAHQWPALQPVRLSGNRGVSAARNAGIRVACGQWVAFLDSDDEWLPEKLARQVAHAAGGHPGPDAVYCRYRRRDDVTGRDTVPAFPLPGEDILDHLLSGWNVPTSLVMVRRSALVAVGGFDEDLGCREDYELWIRLAAAGYRFAPVDEVLVVKHHHAGAHQSGDPAARVRAISVLDRTCGGLVLARRGSRAYRRWLRQQHGRVQFAQFMELRGAVARGDRSRAWRLCRDMSRSLRWSRRYFLQGVVLAAVGPRGYRALARGADLLRARSAGRARQGAE